MARDGAAAAPIRVLVVEDHALVRASFARLVREDARLELAGEAGDGLEALDRMQAVGADVVLMDMSMPRLDGIQATERMRHRWPEVQVLGISVHGGDSAAAGAMRDAGAGHVLSKLEDPEHICDAIVWLWRTRSAPE